MASHELTLWLVAFTGIVGFGETDRQFQRSWRRAETAHEWMGEGFGMSRYGVVIWTLLTISNVVWIRRDRG